MTPRGIYIAACLERRADAVRLAGHLRAEGQPVASRWHDDPLATRLLDATQPRAARVEGAAASLCDLGATSVLLWLADPRRRGALVEVGYALGRGLPVVAVGERDAVTPMAAEADGVTWVASVAEALVLATRLGGRA